MNPIDVLALTPIGWFDWIATFQIQEPNEQSYRSFGLAYRASNHVRWPEFDMPKLERLVLTLANS